MWKEFMFTVDVSNIPWRVDGALYFVRSDAHPGTSGYPGNNAGARYGIGYWGARCHTEFKFIRGIRKRHGWKEQKNDKNSGNGKYTLHVCDKFEHVRSNGREIGCNVLGRGLSDLHD
jgi:hypothetical protein